MNNYPHTVENLLNELLYGGKPRRLVIYLKTFRGLYGQGQAGVWERLPDCVVTKIRVLFPNNHLDDPNDDGSSEYGLHPSQ